MAENRHISCPTCRKTHPLLGSTISSNLTVLSILEMESSSICKKCTKSENLCKKCFDGQNNLCFRCKKIDLLLDIKAAKDRIDDTSSMLPSIKKKIIQVQTRALAMKPICSRVCEIVEEASYLAMEPIWSRLCEIDLTEFSSYFDFDTVEELTSKKKYDTELRKEIEEFEEFRIKAVEEISVLRRNVTLHSRHLPQNFIDEVHTLVSNTEYHEEVIDDLQITLDRKLSKYNEFHKVYEKICNKIESHGNNKQLLLASFISDVIVYLLFCILVFFFLLGQREYFELQLKLDTAKKKEYLHVAMHVGPSALFLFVFKFKLEIYLKNLKIQRGRKLLHSLCRVGFNDVSDD